MSRKPFVIILIILFFAAANLSTAAQQSAGIETATSSNLTGVVLPANAARLSEGNVPVEINQALAKFVAAGGSQIRQGESEILAWTNKNRQLSEPVVIKQLSANLRAAGWVYEESGKNLGVTVFSIYRTVPQKRAFVGFYSSDKDVLVVAWTEMLRADSPLAANDSARTASVPEAKINRQTNESSAVTSLAGAAVVLNIEKRADYVNVMGNNAPPRPQFSPLAPKPGKVRGYVKDSTGKPLQGAAIGVRGTYLAGAYSGAQGKTDQNGYYEFAIPQGVSHYYNAGYQIEWGEGVAALGLQPTDGSLDSFASTDGAVKNFVLLPYGITSRENLQENPHLASTYYGGSIYIGYSAGDAGDAGSIAEDSVMEITLTPEDAGGKTFVIRKVAGFQTGFYINNIPVGHYRITAKVNGKSLKMKDYKKSSPLFGLTPSEAVGEGSVLFEPGDAKASLAVPQYGGWKSVEIYLSMP